MVGYVFVDVTAAGLVVQDIDDPDEDDDDDEDDADDFGDEDDDDLDGDDEEGDEEDDDEGETWQVSNRIRNAKGPARLDFGH